MSDFFRPGADECFVPSHIDPIHSGWTDGTLDEQTAYVKEQRGIDQLQSDMPVAFAAKAEPEHLPEIEAQWDNFQQSKGRGPGSNDLTLIEDFAFGRNFAWEDQFIGSCVISNTFRGWVKRAIVQATLHGESVEYFGRDEFGPASIAPYAPWSYGMMRRRGGLRGGDGGFCKPMGESLLKDGVLPCHSPKLLEILKRLDADDLRDFPEPKSTRVYRRFGDWEFLDELAAEACCPLLDTDVVKSLDDHIRFENDCKPIFQCSMIAVRKVGEHKDGFAIHARDTRNQWAHNMGWQGYFIASDGRRFHRLSNESWGDEVIYNIPDEELDDWYKRRNVSSMTIGQIALRESVPSA